MTRQIALTAAAGLACAAASGMEVHVAPLLHVEEAPMPTSVPGTGQTDLLAALRYVEAGLLVRFKALGDGRLGPPISVAEAITAARTGEAEYMLYGYVAWREHSVQMEMRLLDYGRRQVAQTFFGMDDHNNYERLIEDMAGKIAEHLRERYRLGIEEERGGTTRLLVPISAGYWLPAERDWAEVLVGTVAAATGLDLIPNDSLFTAHGMRLYLTTGIEAKYRFGIGNPAQYEAHSHTMYIGLPLRIAMAITRQHQVFFGGGFVYFLEIFTIREKYEEPKRLLYNNYGTNMHIGYQLGLNERVALFFRNDIDIMINERTLITYAAVLGVGIQVYSREIRRKW